MRETLDFLAKHGYLVLFLNILAEQMGLPIPAAPMLLAMGALAGLGRFSLGLAILIALATSVSTDILWYRLGRARGAAFLALLCRVSLDPDYCVSNTQRFFRKYGSRALLFSRFIPGLGTAAAPLAGLNKMPMAEFIRMDAAGSMLWAGLYMGTGYIFRNQIETVAEVLSALGSKAVVVAVGLLGAYASYQFYRRHKFMRAMRLARITPKELAQFLQDGGEPVIIDLRSPGDVRSTGAILPGAKVLTMASLEEAHKSLPRDRDIVLYCSCPTEASSARAALAFHRKGITRVRPLQGGYAGWTELGFPVVPLECKLQDESLPGT